MMNLLTLKRACDQMPPLNKKYETPSHKVGDLVLLKNCNTSSLQTKYIPNYRIIKLIGDRAVNLHYNFGNIKRAHISDIQTMYPAEYFLSHLPPTSLFGRPAKYVNDPHTFQTNLDKIPPVMIPTKNTSNNPQTKMPDNNGAKCLVPAAHLYNLRLNKKTFSPKHRA